MTSEGGHQDMTPPPPPRLLSSSAALEDEEEEEDNELTSAHLQAQHQSTASPLSPNPNQTTSSLYAVLKQAIGDREHLEQEVSILSQSVADLAAQCEEKDKLWFGKCEALSEQILKLKDELAASKKKKKTKKKGAPDLDEHMAEAQRQNDLLRALLDPLETEITRLRKALNDASSTATETHDEEQQENGHEDSTSTGEVVDSKENPTKDKRHPPTPGDEHFRALYQREKEVTSDLVWQLDALTSQRKAFADEVAALRLQLQKERREKEDLELTWKRSTEAFMDSQRIIATQEVELARLEKELIAQRDSSNPMKGSLGKQSGSLSNVSMTSASSVLSEPPAHATQPQPGPGPQAGNKEEKHNEGKDQQHQRQEEEASSSGVKELASVASESNTGDGSNTHSAKEQQQQPRTRGLLSWGKRRRKSGTSQKAGEKAAEAQDAVADKYRSPATGTETETETETETMTTTRDDVPSSSEVINGALCDSAEFDGIDRIPKENSDTQPCIDFTDPTKQHEDSMHEESEDNAADYHSQGTPATPDQVADTRGFVSQTTDSHITTNSHNVADDADDADDADVRIASTGSLVVVSMETGIRKEKLPENHGHEVASHGDPCHPCPRPRTNSDAEDLPESIGDNVLEVLKCQLNEERRKHQSRLQEFDNDLLKLRQAHSEELSLHVSQWQEREKSYEEEISALKVQLTDAQNRSRRKARPVSRSSDAGSVSITMFQTYEQQVADLQAQLQEMLHMKEDAEHEVDLVINACDETIEHAVTSYKAHLDQVVAQNEVALKKTYEERVQGLETQVMQEMAQMQTWLTEIEQSQEQIALYKADAEELLEQAVGAKRSETERLRQSLADINKQLKLKTDEAEALSKVLETRDAEKSQQESASLKLQQNIDSAQNEVIDKDLALHELQMKLGALQQDYSALERQHAHTLTQLAKADAATGPVMSRSRAGSRNIARKSGNDSNE